MYCDENNVGYPNDLKMKKYEHSLNDCPLIFSEIDKTEKLLQTPNTGTISKINENDMKIEPNK